MQFIKSHLPVGQLLPGYVTRWKSLPRARDPQELKELSIFLPLLVLVAYWDTSGNCPRLTKQLRSQAGIHGKLEFSFGMERRQKNLRKKTSGRHTVVPVATTQILAKIWMTSNQWVS